MSSDFIINLHSTFANMRAIVFTSGVQKFLSVIWTIYRNFMFVSHSFENAMHRFNCLLTKESESYLVLLAKLLNVKKHCLNFTRHTNTRIDLSFLNWKYQF